MIFLAAADAAFLEKKARKKSIKARETKFSDSARLAHRQSSNRVKILIRRPQCESCKRLWLLAVVKAIAGAHIKGFREASICGKWSAVDLSLEPTTWPFHVRARKNPIKTSRKASNSPSDRGDRCVVAALACTNTLSMSRSFSFSRLPLSFSFGAEFPVEEKVFTAR